MPATKNLVRDFSLQVPSDTALGVANNVAQTVKVESGLYMLAASNNTGAPTSYQILINLGQAQDVPLSQLTYVTGRTYKIVVPDCTLRVVPVTTPRDAPGTKIDVAVARLGDVVGHAEADSVPDLIDPLDPPLIDAA